MHRATLYSGITSVLAYVRSGWRRPLAVSAACLGVLLFSSALQRPPIPFETCLFRIITGLPCPSCGMTRSFIHMGHFHFNEALYFNIMGPVLYASVVIALVVSLYELIWGKPVLAALWQKYRLPITVMVCLAATTSWAWNIYKKTAGLSLGY